MTSNIPRKRRRASSKQLSKMVDFMVENPGLAKGTYQKLHGKFECDKKWNDLASILNKHGPTKSATQWHTVWRDLKSRTTIKCRDRKWLKSLNGNRPVKLALTSLEKRLIALVRSDDYIEVHQPVIENVKIEKELQQRIGEEDSLFSDMPSISSISAMELQYEPMDNPAKRNSPPTIPKRSDEDDESHLQAKFLEIAKTQADALMILAETSAANLEIAKTQAAALKMIAGYSAASIEANKKMADAIKTMGEGLKQIADSFNLL